MKKLFLTLLAVSALTFQSCDNDDDNPVTPTQPSDENVSGEITTNITWTSDRIWVINQKVVVKSGATLTIQPGTIIKAKTGSGSLASALIIARGGKIMAEGTVDKPIIFTSVSDNIKLGEKAGTNLTTNDTGLWGGVLILGNAKCSLAADVTELQIEGIPASDTFGLYGGTNDADNSGVFKYVSIRHGGAEIGEGNEINGLTLGGVGSGTQISNVEVVANFDDGVEFFGGTVSASNLLVYAVGDDGLDIDQSYAGTISNSMVVHGATGGSGLEIDGPEGSYLASFTLNKITLKGHASNSAKVGEYKSKARGASNNVYVYDYPTASTVKISDAVSSANYTAGDLSFATWNVKATALTGIFVDAGNAASTFSGAAFASAVTAPATGVGADTSVFSWTYAKLKSAF